MPDRDDVILGLRVIRQFTYDPRAQKTLDDALTILRDDADGLAEIHRKLGEGTMHRLTCNADQRGPIGNPGCSCPPGREIKRLRHLLREHWKPVETAPDERLVLLTLVMRDGSPVNPDGEPAYTIGWLEDGDWMLECMDGETSTTLRPSHWMPLPLPPSQAGAS